MALVGAGVGGALAASHTKNATVGKPIVDSVLQRRREQLGKIESLRNEGIISDTEAVQMRSRIIADALSEEPSEVVCYEQIPPVPSDLELATRKQALDQRLRQLGHL